MGKPFAFNTDVWPGLAKVLEETNELGVELSKLLMVGGQEAKYWGGRPLRQKILEESADVIASTSYMVAKNFDKEEQREFFARIDRKLATYGEWEKTE